MSAALAAVPRQFAEAVAVRIGLTIYAVSVEVPAPT